MHLNIDVWRSTLSQIFGTFKLSDPQISGKMTLKWLFIVLIFLLTHKLVRKIYVNYTFNDITPNSSHAIKSQRKTSLLNNPHFGISKQLSYKRLYDNNQQKYIRNCHNSISPKTIS